MDEYPRRIKKQLRTLLGEAYTRELTRELRQLAAHFEEWQAGEISAGELSSLIHAYDVGPSRDMFRFYNNISPVMVVGRAVAEGLLTLEDIPEEVWPYIENAMEFFREGMED